VPLPPLSVLDLAPIVEGATPREALGNSLDLAQHVERWGYNRFWLAEHHNAIGIASAATAVVIAHVAAGTRTIRVGAGGVMLPNHAPIVIAEQFGTLEALHPGRIDLGLGRAPGTDQLTIHALRRDPTSADTFPQDVVELQRFLADKAARIGQPLRLRVQLRSFDAVCRLVECNVGIGIVPESTARRVARTMAIVPVALTDPWAARELTICIRSFDELPPYARQLVEHLRTAA